MVPEASGLAARRAADAAAEAVAAATATLERVGAAGLSWPLPAMLSDRVLEAMLYAGHGSQQRARRKAEPDWAYVHHELPGPASR